MTNSNLSTRIHTKKLIWNPLLAYHKTKRDLNDETIRQISFIIHTPKSIKNPVKTKKK